MAAPILLKEVMPGFRYRTPKGIVVEGPRDLLIERLLKEVLGADVFDRPDREDSWLAHSI